MKCKKITLNPIVWIWEKEDANKQVNEMNKIVQNLSKNKEIKKTQTIWILKLENLGKRTVTSFTNRIQEMEEIISGIEDMMEEIDITAKKMQNLKFF